MTGTSSKPPVRRSSRLIIVSSRKRLLLFRYHDEHRPPFWATVGGELVGDEDFRAAARRELAEETGFRASIGPQIWRRESVYAVARARPALWHERYFLVEVEQESAPSRAGWTDEERSTIRKWRWWSLREMKEAGEELLPTRLPEVLAAAISGSSLEGD